MLSIILNGPIWVEVLSVMIGKALIAGGLTVIKATPQIKNVTNAKNGDQQKSQSVIDVFKDIK